MNVRYALYMDTPTDPISDAARKTEIELTCKYIKDPILNRASLIVGDTGRLAISVIHHEDGTYRVGAILHSSYSIIVTTERTITEWDLASNTISKRDWISYINGIARDIAKDLSFEAIKQQRIEETKRASARISAATSTFVQEMKKTEVAVRGFNKAYTAPLKKAKNFNRSRGG